MAQHNVFVYGTLKEGFWNHHHLKGAHKIGVGLTHGRFGMWNVGFPLIRHEKDCAGYPAEGMGQVRGEVYRVSDKHMASMDRLENNGRMYQREEVRVHCTNAAGQTETVLAWCYVWMLGPQGRPVPAKDGIIDWDGRDDDDDEVGLSDDGED